MRSLLPRLRQPSRYTGIEQGAVHKDPSAVTVRAALCFPDLYEVGMSHLGQKIIYGIVLFFAVLISSRKKSTR